MREVAAWLYVTLDGVVQDPENWVIHDEQMNCAIDAEAAAADTLLLGRRTYENFAASWPEHSQQNDPIADWINAITKVVVSTRPDTLDWQNSTRIKDAVIEEIQQLKQQPGKNILIQGSPSLVRYLLRQNQLDRLRLFVHPLIAGTGTQLFDQTINSRLHLSLTESRALDNGVLDLTYTPRTTETAPPTPSIGLTARRG